MEYGCGATQNLGLQSDSGSCVDCEDADDEEGEASTKGPTEPLAHAGGPSPPGPSPPWSSRMVSVQNPPGRRGGPSPPPRPPFGPGGPSPPGPSHRLAVQNPPALVNVFAGRSSNFNSNVVLNLYNCGFDITHVVHYHSPDPTHN